MAEKFPRSLGDIYTHYVPQFEAPGGRGDVAPFGYNDLMTPTVPSTDELLPIASTQTPYETEKAVQTGDEKGRSDIQTDRQNDTRD